jgi:hypothetical protein
MHAPTGSYAGSIAWLNYNCRRNMPADHKRRCVHGMCGWSCIIVIIFTHFGIGSKFVGTCRQTWTRRLCFSDIIFREICIPWAHSLIGFYNCWKGNQRVSHGSLRSRQGQRNHASDVGWIGGVSETTVAHHIYTLVKQITLTERHTSSLQVYRSDDTHASLRLIANPPPSMRFNILNFVCNIQCRRGLGALDPSTTLNIGGNRTGVSWTPCMHYKTGVPWCACRMIGFSNNFNKHCIQRCWSTVLIRLLCRQ